MGTSSNLVRACLLDERRKRSKNGGDTWRKAFMICINLASSSRGPVNHTYGRGSGSLGPQHRGRTIDGDVVSASHFAISHQRPPRPRSRAASFYSLPGSMSLTLDRFSAALALAHEGQSVFHGHASSKCELELQRAGHEGRRVQPRAEGGQVVQIGLPERHATISRTWHGNHTHGIAAQHPTEKLHAWETTATDGEVYTRIWGDCGYRKRKI
jgi:hypothetical protein